MKLWQAVTAGSFILGALFVSNSTRAEDPAQEGLNAALEVCANLTYSSDKTKCLDLTRGARFYDPAVVKTCSELIYRDDKLNCLKVTKDRLYLAAELKICQSLTYKADKMKCIEKAGQPYQPPVAAEPVVEPKPEPIPEEPAPTSRPGLKRRQLRQIESSVDRALEALKKGKNKDAKIILEELTLRLKEMR